MDVKMLMEHQRDELCDITVTVCLSSFLQVELTRRTLDKKLTEVCLSLRKFKLPVQPSAQLSWSLKGVQCNLDGSDRTKKEIVFLPRCQDIDKSAFVEPDEAASAFAEASGLQWRKIGDQSPLLLAPPSAARAASTAT